MNNLSQRIITSAVLLFILSLSLFYNKYIWLFVIIIASLILFIEFNNLAKKIWRKKKNTINADKFIATPYFFNIPIFNLR